jgi:D-aminopeptidase
MPGSFADSGYQAVATVAQHDKPLSGGFSAHTIMGGASPIFDGSTVTETELIGYAHGTAGIPVIFSSGDDHLERTLRIAMPWIEYVTVKKVSSSGVEVLPAERVRAELRAGAARAMRGLQIPGRMRPMRLTPPIRAGVVFTFPLRPSPYIDGFPGLQQRGDTLTFVAADYPTAIRGILAVIFVGVASSDGYLLDLVARTPVGGRLVSEAMDTLMSQQEAFENGKWKPPRSFFTQCGAFPC